MAASFPRVVYLVLLAFASLVVRAQEHHNHYVYEAPGEGSEPVMVRLEFCREAGVERAAQVGAAGEGEGERAKRPVFLGVAKVDAQFRFCLAMPTRGWLAFGLHGNAFGDAMENADIWQFASGEPPRQRDAFAKVNGPPLDDADCGGSDDLKDVAVMYNATTQLTVVRWSRDAVTDDPADRSINASAGFVRAILAFEDGDSGDFAKSHTHRTSDITNPSRSDEVWVDFGAVGGDAPVFCVGKHVACRPQVPEGKEREDVEPPPLACGEKDADAHADAPSPAPAPAPAPVPAPAPSHHGGGGGNGGAIAGGIFGVLIAIGGAAGGVFLWRRRQREKRMRGWLEMSNTGFDFDALDDDEGAF